MRLQLQTKGLHKRLLWGILSFMLSTSLAMAQSVASYTLSTNTTSSLDADINLNLVDMTTGTTQLVAPDLDDNASAVTNIGFTFTFGGSNFTQFSANSNGMIRLGATVIGGATYSSNAATAAGPIIAAMGGDLRTGIGGKVHYKLVGTSPNQTLVVEFLNMSLDYVGTPGSNDGTFQIRLYESTNVIEFVYGSMFRNNSATNSATQTFNISLATGTASPNRICVDTTNTLNTTGTLIVNNYVLNAFMAKVHSTANGNRRAYIFSPPPPAAPAVITGTFSGLTSSQVTLAGNVPVGAYPGVTASGFVVSMSPNPTIGSAIDSTTNPVVTSGNMSKTITGLINGTQYYYRAYATNSVGTTYGYDSTFTTNASAAVPTVLRTAANTITINRAIVGGNITLDGGAPVTASGVVYATSLSPLPALGGPGVVDSTTTPLVTNGTYSFNLGGLTPNTKYYYRAYANNSSGTGYSIVDSFTTLPLNPPTITVQTPSSVSSTSAILAANITNNGNGTISASGFVFSLTTNPSIGDPGVVDSTTSPVVITGAFTKAIGGLVQNTKYYYRAYAINQAGTSYSTLDSIITPVPISSLPYAQNFDGVGSTGWTTAPFAVGNINEWVMGTPAKTVITAANSAPNCWITKTVGNYSSYHNGSLISPQFDFSSLTASPILRFKHKFRTELNCCDGGWVEMSINGGAWTKVENVLGTAPNFNTANATSWYNYAIGQGNAWNGNSTNIAGNVGGWLTSQVPLAGAAGQSDVRFRFRFYSDVSSEFDGWAIDDIEVFSPATPTMVTGTKTNITTSSVTLAGSITDNGGLSVTASGIVLSLSPAPVRGAMGVADSTTSPLVVTGSFTRNFADLSPATTYYYRSYGVNSLGTSYGPDSSFTTNASAIVPSVLRNTATNITTNTVTIGGNITSDGGSVVTASGVVYSTSPNPSLGGPGVVDSTTTPLVISGTFSLNPAGLTHSTKYYYRAYATNAVGTAYSIEDSFTTSPIISAFPYTQNFDAVGNTGWSTAPFNVGNVNEWVMGTPAKTVISAANSAPNCWITKTVGNYSSYHNGSLISPQFDFSTLTASPILRFKHKFVTEANCCDGGWVEMSINGGAWTKVENVLGTGPNFNTPNATSWYNYAIGQGNAWNGNSTNMAGNVGGWLTSQVPLAGAAGQSDVKFRFRFYSDVSAEYDGWAIDDIEIYLPTAPTVITGTKTNITTNNATLAGNITNNGSLAVTASGIVISTSPAPVRGGFGVIDSVSTPLVSNGNFTINTTGLSPATTYYYRAYAVNSVGTSYGDDSTFVTNASAVAPTVIRIAATNINITTVTVGGNITSDGGSPVTASGVVYSTSPNPALGGPGVIDSTTNPLVTLNSFTVNPAGLTHSTKYYFRAYAVNAAGTSYSDEDSFATAPIVSAFPYSQNFDVAGTTGWSTAPFNVGNINEWVMGTPAKTVISAANSAPNCWITKTVGNYSSNHNGSLISPQFDFSALTTNPILRFKHKFVTEVNCCDGGWVEMSINGGAWTKVENVLGTGPNFNTPNAASWYNYAIGQGNAWNGNSTTIAGNVGGWLTSQVPLTGAAGQSDVKFRFRFYSDVSAEFDGWAIDDIEVFVVTTPTLAASNVTATPGNTNANVTFTAGNGEGRLVVARLTTDAAVAPTDFTLYTANAAFGSGNTTGTGNFVVYNGTGTSVNVTGLTQLTNYTFDVYEYNGRFMHVRFASAASTNTTTTPVKLVSFTGNHKNGSAILTWTTASEVNNRGFNVERSIDGKNFEFVTFVKGAGNSLATLRYGMTDADVFNKTGAAKIYYRLKQLDFDGKSEYSNVISVVSNENLNFKTIAFPVPFSNELNIEITNNINERATLALTDLEGRTITVKQIDLVSGTALITVKELDYLKSGMYFITVTAQSGVQTVKVVKN